MTFELATVLAATGASALRLERDGTFSRDSLQSADLRTPLSGVSIDSRSTGPDDLFVALPGERVDGHDFVAAALRRGARAALVDRVPEPAAGQVEMQPRQTPHFLLLVPNPLGALQSLARFWRRQLGTEVVGITGSIGKTTTKEIVAGVLQSSVSVLKSEANLNTEIGVPLMLLRLRPEHRVAVLEMGMYGPGDIAVLAQIAEPQVGIVTNVAPVHLERTGSIEVIARTKSELVQALPPHGLAILNGDDPWTRAMAQTSGVAPVILVGQGQECHYQAENVTPRGLDGFSFTLSAERRRMRCRASIPGVHLVNAFLAAAAVARRAGMEWGEIVDAMEKVRLDVRQRLLRGREEMLVIDDSYNAAPMSMYAALELLRSAPGTRIAVLGDMLELGPDEEIAHRQVGEYAAEIADWLVVRGSRSGWIADAAEKHGLARERIVRAADNADAARAVLGITSAILVGAGEAPPSQSTASQCSVLVKGSRGMAMEEIVETLRGAS